MVPSDSSPPSVAVVVVMRWTGRRSCEPVLEDLMVLSLGGDEPDLSLLGRFDDLTQVTTIDLVEDVTPKQGLDVPFEGQVLRRNGGIWDLGGDA